MRLRSLPTASPPHRGALVHARAARTAARVRAGPPCRLPALARRPPVCSTMSPRGPSRGGRSARDAAHATVQDAVASLVGVRRHMLPPRPRAAPAPASAASAANRVRPPPPSACRRRRLAGAPRGGQARPHRPASVGRSPQAPPAGLDGRHCARARIPRHASVGDGGGPRDARVAAARGAGDAHGRAAQRPRADPAFSPAQWRFTGGGTQMSLLAMGTHIGI